MNDFYTTSSEKTGSEYIYDAVVVQVDPDGYGNGEIVARIPKVDKDSNVDELPKSYPIWGLFLYAPPKVGEHVRVMMAVAYNSDDSFNREKRYYFPSVISQPQNLKHDPYYYTSTSTQSDGWVEPQTPIEQIVSARGIHPDKDDVAILGRDNADLTLKSREAIIRAGRHSVDNNVMFNNVNPSYIQLKFQKGYLETTTKSDITSTVEIIQPEYDINVVIDNQNRLLIKVIRMEDSFVVDTYSQSFDTTSELMVQVKKTLSQYRKKYDKWQLTTQSVLLQNERRIFPNNQKIVKQEVQSINTLEDAEGQGSVVNIVADRINLLSHKSSTYNLAKRDGLIDTQTQKNIHQNGSPLVKGDNLTELLSLIVNVLLTHNHPYHASPTVKNQLITQLENFNIQDILNNNIRI